MQLLPPINPDMRAAAREKFAGAHLPYLRHVDPVTLATRDGLLMQTIRVRGLLFETADSDELNYRAALRDTILQTLGSSGFALYHHIIRRKAEISNDAVFGDAFSEHLDARWRARISERRMYVNDLYLTVIRRPVQGRVGFLTKLAHLLPHSAEERAVQALAEQRALDTATQALMAGLSSYGPQLLSVRETETGGFRSEILEFLGSLYNAETQAMELPLGDIGHHIPFRRVSFGERTLELSEAGLYGRKYGALVSIKDYPAYTFPGMFDELYRLPYELVVSQSFAFVESRDAINRMNTSLRRMNSAEDEALSLRQELVRAKDDVAAGRAGFGEHHSSIMVSGDTLEEVNAGVAEVSAVLADLGIVGVREDIGLEPVYWAQFPGNLKYIARKALVSTTNFAGLASLHNFPVGKAHANHWGDAVTLFETTAAGPYFFSFHHGDLGNFTVIGPSGSGKTVVLNFLLAQARKFAPRVVFFDKDRGAELFIRAVGGQYDRLRPGIASGLNPLLLDDTPENRQFLVEWLSMLAGGVSIEEAEIVNDAVKANFAAPKTHRQLRHLVELYKGTKRSHAGDLYARMRPWVNDGEHSWLFDNEQDKTDLSADTVGFDMTSILDDPFVRTPALYYFFHRVEQRLDGSPAIIVVDEGWKALDDEVFVRKIKDWEKTIRKRNGIIGFATQSASDALESKIASAIIEQAATQIFMINPKAKAEEYMGGFGLTQHEFDLIRTLPDNSHCFLIKHGKESVVARLNLTGEKEILTILSGREETVRVLDDLMQETGELPATWVAQLMNRV